MSDQGFEKSFAEMRKDAGGSEFLSGLVMRATTRRKEIRTPTGKLIALGRRWSGPIAILTLTIWISCSVVSLICLELDKSFDLPMIQVLMAPSDLTEGEAPVAAIQVGGLSLLGLLSGCTAWVATILLGLGILFATACSNLPSDPLDEAMEA